LIKDSAGKPTEMDEDKQIYTGKIMIYSAAAGLGMARMSLWHFALDELERSNY
jgi:hypothetical protein